MAYLNKDLVNGKEIHTSARNDGNGNPITDVSDSSMQAKMEELKA